MWQCIRVAWSVYQNLDCRVLLPDPVSAGPTWGLSICISQVPRRCETAALGTTLWVAVMSRKDSGNGIEIYAFKAPRYYLTNIWLYASYSTPLVLCFLLVENEGHNWLSSHGIRWDCIIEPFKKVRLCKTLSYNIFNIMNHECLLCIRCTQGTVQGSRGQGMERKRAAQVWQMPRAKCVKGTFRIQGRIGCSGLLGRPWPTLYFVKTIISLEDPGHSMM